MAEGETLGERVRRLRLDLGLSQAQLAEKSTIAPGTIGDIEQGVQKTPGRKIDRLAAALGKSAEYLRTGLESGGSVLIESSLTQREMRLIHLFRSMGNTGKSQVEAYASGLQGSIKERRPQTKQTAQEIRGAKSRRTG